MKEISDYIAEGAMAFLKANGKYSDILVVVGILLAVMANSNPHSHWSIALAFVMGAVLSATAGYIGMKAATKANVRTAQAARTSLSKALNVSFTGGAVMECWRCRPGCIRPGWIIYYISRYLLREPPSTRKKWSGPSKY